MPRSWWLVYYNNLLAWLPLFSFCYFKPLFVLPVEISWLNKFWGFSDSLQCLVYCWASVTSLFAAACMCCNAANIHVLSLFIFFMISTQEVATPPPRVCVCLDFFFFILQCLLSFIVFYGSSYTEFDWLDFNCYYMLSIGFQHWA